MNAMIGCAEDWAGVGRSKIERLLFVGGQAAGLSDVLTKRLVVDFPVELVRKVSVAGPTEVDNAGGFGRRHFRPPLL